MKDLIKLYSFESVHNTPDEKEIADWICKWLETHDIIYNRLGNTIYNLEYSDAPILSAHLDQVKTNGKAVKFFMNDAEKIIAFNDKWERTSLGADDKNGVWIILKALEEGCYINFIISEGEETGCVGIKKLEDNKTLSTFIDESQYCLVLDRRGNEDMLSSGGGSTFCSTLAQSLCNFTGQDFKVTSGSISDTCTLCNYCESVNMSVAYDNPHTANEMTDFKRLKEIKDHVINIVTEFSHYSTPTYIYSKTTYSCKNWRDYYGY